MTTDWSVIGVPIDSVGRAGGTEHAPAAADELFLDYRDFENVREVASLITPVPGATSTLPSASPSRISPAGLSRKSSSSSLSDMRSRSSKSVGSMATLEKPSTLMA